jgi:hypothetical protein
VNDDTAKFEAIAPTLRWMPKWIRENLSPRAAWTIIVFTFTCGGYIAHEASSRFELERRLEDEQQRQDEQVKATKELASTVNQLNMNVAVLVTKVDDIGQRVDEQAEKWQRVESAAEIRVPRHKGR